LDEGTYDLDVLKDHAGAINCMAVSEDGSILATGSDDNTIRLWTSKAPRCDCIGILAGHENYITCVVIEEIFVVSGSVDKTVRKWDMATCVCLAVLTGHDERINRLICTGDFVFSSSVDATIRCWDLDDCRCIREFAGHLNSVFPLMYIPIDDDEEEEPSGTDAGPENVENSDDLQRSTSESRTGRQCSCGTRGQTMIPSQSISLNAFRVPHWFWGTRGQSDTDPSTFVRTL